jgi:hypothetical protein
MGDQPVARPLSAHRTTQTQNKRIQTAMPRVGFEPTIPVFEGVKTVHALDRAATMIGCFCIYVNKTIKIIKKYQENGEIVFTKCQTASQQESGDKEFSSCFLA